MKKKLLSIILLTIMMCSICLPSFATTISDDAFLNDKQSNNVIDESDDIEVIVDSIAEISFDPNVTVDSNLSAQGSDVGNYIRVAVSPVHTTANVVVLTVTNIGPDSIDTVGMEVTVQGPNKTTLMNVVPKPYSVGSHDVTVRIPQHSVSEKITVSIYAQESGQTVIGTASAKRNLNDSFVNAWADGGRGSSANNLNHHYWKHKDDNCLVGINNILNYCQDANSCLRYFKQQHTKGVYNPGATPNTYKFYNVSTHQYMLAVGNSKKEAVGPIVSYGGNTIAQ